MTAVIAAAGSGERLGAGGPKAFVPLAGRPMIAWSLDACLAAGTIVAVVVAVPAAYAHGLEGMERVEVVDGGSTRAGSVANALATVDTEYVAIHDAARPLVTPELIDALVSELATDPSADAIIAAAPVTDTVKKVRAAEGAHGAHHRRPHPRPLGALGGADASGLPDGRASRRA